MFKIFVWIVTRQFLQIYNTVMALSFAKKSCMLYILWTNRWNLIKILICIELNQIMVGIVFCKFLHIFNIVMALDYRQNFVPAEYLENELRELDHILHMFDVDQIFVLIVTRQCLQKIHHDYGSWLLPKLRFRSMSCEQIDGL